MHYEISAKHIHHENTGGISGRGMVMKEKSIFVEGEENTADVLTKPLVKVKHEKHTANLLKDQHAQVEKDELREALIFWWEH